MRSISERARRPAGAPLAIGVALIAASLLLGWVVELDLTAGFDVAVLRWFHGWAGSDLWVAITRLGNAPGRIAIGIVLALLLAWRRGWLIAAFYLATVAVESAAGASLKLVFARVRPDLFPHLDHVSTFSYPSGHAAHGAALLLTAALLAGRGGAIVAAALLAMLIGGSRPVLAVHWPTDVIGGWMFGTGFALAGLAVTRAAIDRVRVGRYSARLP